MFNCKYVTQFLLNDSVRQTINFLGRLMDKGGWGGVCATTAVTQDFSSIQRKHCRYVLTLIVHDGTNVRVFELHKIRSVFMILVGLFLN